MRIFRFYVDGIDSPKEHVVVVRANTRPDAYAKAVVKWGHYRVHYSPTPRAGGGR